MTEQNSININVPNGCVLMCNVHINVQLDGYIIIVFCCKNTVTHGEMDLFIFLY